MPLITVCAHVCSALSAVAAWLCVCVRLTVCCDVLWCGFVCDAAVVYCAGGNVLRLCVSDAPGCSDCVCPSWCLLLC